jgi:hypothetical protein
MAIDRTLADARLKGMRSEILRGLGLVALRRAEEVREQTRAARAEIAQRRLAEARQGTQLRLPPQRSAAPR